MTSAHVSACCIPSWSDEKLKRHDLIDKNSPGSEETVKDSAQSRDQAVNWCFLHLPSLDSARLHLKSRNLARS